MDDELETAESSWKSESLPELRTYECALDYLLPSLARNILLFLILSH